MKKINLFFWVIIIFHFFTNISSNIGDKIIAKIEMKLLLIMIL